jgi:hypothetical protein
MGGGGGRHTFSGMGSDVLRQVRCLDESLCAMRALKRFDCLCQSSTEREAFSRWYSHRGEGKWKMRWDESRMED